MNNTILIMRHEIYKTLHNVGYVIFAFVIPVIAVVALSIVQAARQQNGGGGIDAAGSQPMTIEGYVDQSGLIQQLPENIPADRLVRLANEEVAQEALAYGAITAYYLIPADVLEGGRVRYVYSNERSFLDDGQPWVMHWTLMVNMLGGDAALADKIWNPVGEVFLTSLETGVIDPSEEDCSRPGSACQSIFLVRLMPSIMVALFFATFLSSSNSLFNSISKEKENRMIEVMMTSVTPKQLLAGKMLGLGATGLLQTVFWLFAIYISINRNGSLLKLPEDFAFPVDILVLSLAFFLGGFGLYASLMAGAGALVPKMKEAGAANYIAMIPLFIGYMVGFMAPYTETGNSLLVILLSIFPLTSPVLMIMRIVNGSVQLWQLILALVLLFLSAYYVLHVAARMFHTQNLLSGESFSMKRYLSAFAGRV